MPSADTVPAVALATPADLPRPPPLSELQREIAAILSDIEAIEARLKREFDVQQRP